MYARSPTRRHQCFHDRKKKEKRNPLFLTASHFAASNLARKPGSQYGCSRHSPNHSDCSEHPASFCYDMTTPSGTS